MDLEPSLWLAPVARHSSTKRIRAYRGDQSERAFGFIGIGIDSRWHPPNALARLVSLCPSHVQNFGLRFAVRLDTHARQIRLRLGDELFDFRRRTVCGHSANMRMSQFTRQPELILKRATRPFASRFAIRPDDQNIRSGAGRMPLELEADGAVGSPSHVLAEVRL